MMILTVTGGIGSGKSEVCRIIHSLYGYPVYEADVKVKELYSTCPGLLDKIARALGCTLTDDDGKFVPERMAERIFGDGEALETVEALVFPALIEDFNLWKNAFADEEAVVFESATILEKEFFSTFSDRVIVVDAPFDVRLERACRRTGAPTKSILSRMQAQRLMNSISEGYVDPRVDAVIKNDKDLASLESAVRSAIDGLLTNKHN